MEDRIITDQSDVERSSHFQTGGAAYARYRPTYPPALAEALASLAPNRSLAVDVGCGAGQLSVLLAEAFERVEARDVSADQIAHAAAHPRVRYAVAPAEALGVAPCSAALITAAQAAHWFDLPRFYAEVRRIAAPGAVLALISYGVAALEGPLAERFAEFYWRDLAACWPPERRHVETGYAEFDFPFDECAPPPLRIERRWDLAALLGYVETWSAIKQARRRGLSDRIDAFFSDARELWGDPATERRVTWPIAMRVGVV